MTGPLRDALARLVDAHKKGAPLALLFDYDGTLVPFAEHPGMALLGDLARDQLERLSRVPSVFVGVLSGRSIDNLREAVGIKNLFYVGTNGLELSFGKTTFRHPDSQRGSQLTIAATEQIRHISNSYAGAWIERKPLGLTVHYRNVKQPDRIEKLRTDVARAIEPFSRELQVLDAAMAIEIAPDLGWTKGTALRMILAHIGDRAVLPLYAGDEANDADALMTAAQLGGVAIGVGQVAPSTAHYRLADPLAFSRCVDSLLNMLVATSVPACHP